MRRVKKKLKGERLTCGICLSASSVCIPPCFVPLIAANMLFRTVNTQPGSLSPSHLAHMRHHPLFCICVWLNVSECEEIIVTNANRLSKTTQSRSE